MILRLLASAAVLLVPAWASAQAVRFDRLDGMTDKRLVYVIAPARDGRAAFVVGCSGIGMRSFELEKLSGAVKLLARFDQHPPVTASGYVKSPDMAIEPGNAEAFADELAKASRLVLRIDGASLKDYEFNWSTDNKPAFASAAESAGGDRNTAAAGYDFLTRGISRAAAGQYRALADLLNAMNVKWRVDGRPVETDTIIKPIMEAMRRNKSRKEVEDAGNVMFGAAWTAIRPLVQPDAQASYADLNKPMAEQIAWLRRNCPSS